MTGRDRRALLAGTAVVGLAILVLKLAPWGWRRITEDGAELRSRAELLERMRVEVGSTSLLEDSSKVVRDRMATLGSRFLTGDTAAEAASDLGARLAVFAERHQVRVTRTEPVPDSAGNKSLAAVSLRAVLESDNRGLLQFLQSVARNQAALVVGEVRVAVADPMVRRDRPEILHTEVVVRGWYLPARRSS